MNTGFVESLFHQWSRVRRRAFTMLLAGQFKEFGCGAAITPPLRFYGLNQMSIGAGASIERNCWIQVVNADGDHRSTKLVIGAHAGIGMGASISTARQVVLGDYVLLGRNVYISDHAHAFENVELPIMQQGINNVQPVTIGKHSWLGQNVVVLPGTSIGRHCVIGANAVVKGEIPDFSIAVGAPARVVKRYNTSSKRWEKVA